jgi:hypothetical protein
MAAALEAGVTRLFRVGGAHAIAALAYGTATIPRVDKSSDLATGSSPPRSRLSPETAQSISTRVQPKS